MEQNNVAKSKNWFLVRLNNGSEFALNEGHTQIGRRREADICTPSTICSRDHCTITLHPDDTINIQNHSQNHTYVNDGRINKDDSLQLRENDIIGLGCDQTAYDLAQGEEKNKFFMYRLINKKDPILISDDEEEDVKPVLYLENLNLFTANGSIAGPANEHINDVLPAVSEPSPEPLNPVSNDDSHYDDNEIQYSQQILNEIKTEVNIAGENVEHEEDFTIYISDESNDGENSWIEKLSQNQDFVIKKVEKSIENKKRKACKQIEPIPVVPTKKARRNFVSITKNKRPSTTNESNANGKITKLRALNKEPNVSHKGSSPPGNEPSCLSSKQPSPSNHKSSSKSPKSPRIESGANLTDKNETPENLIDRFDPFAPKFKKPEKPASFEAALQIASSPIGQRKKRIAHTPKRRGTNDWPSILRLKNGSWPSDGKRNKHNLCVHFENKSPDIHEYQPNEDEAEEILVNFPVKPTATKSTNSNYLSECFENDPLHEIITDVTEWKPEWLAQKSSTPPINGVNLIVYPLINKYPSFGHYKSIIIPLMKHELWSMIQAENRNRNGFQVQTNHGIDFVKRCGRHRYVIRVQVIGETGNAKAQVGDFVVVKGDPNLCFFAYVTNQRFTTSGYGKTFFLTMETSEHAVKLKEGDQKSFIITSIANIRAELKLFNAVLYLERSPLKDLILDASSYVMPNIPDRTQKFTYTGYDKLNEEQEHILKSVYNKSLDSSNSLSLIEGPPGTGKTRLIVSIILQLLFSHDMKKKLRILVLSSSNNAVDIIARRLLHIRDKMKIEEKRKMMSIVRFGVLSSMHPDVQQIAPQNLKIDHPISPSGQCENEKAMNDEKKRLMYDIEKLRKKTNAKNTVVQDQIAALEKQYKQIDETLKRKPSESNHSNDIYDVMMNARIICSTLSSSINLKQYIRYFDVCFIDEASQCTEPWSLVPLQYHIKSLILVGDPNQLSPVVLSPVCREKTFERSLFTRLFETISKNGTHTHNTYSMTQQYRMHPAICDFPNKYFYRKRLTSDPSTFMPIANFTLKPYALFNLKYQQSNKDLVNYWNEEEANFIVYLLKVMIKHADPKIFSYGIITPYAKQRLTIEHLLANSKTLAEYRIPVGTIDSNQGQEKDIIILCTTRTTGIGFLANPQRLNVALTRAKKCMVICGNFISISPVRVWSELINNAKQRQMYYDIPAVYNFQTIADLIRKRPETTQPK